MNPYNWRGNRPRIEVQRAGVEEVALDLKRGGSGVLLAGRGMGKSVFLWQVEARLRAFPDVIPVLFPAPPATLSVPALVRALARKLGVEASEHSDPEEVLEGALNKVPDKTLVLLYDEFDRHATMEPAPGDAAGRHFFNSLEVMRRTHEPRLGILAAGGIGVFLFRDVLGSSFTARAASVRVRSFEATQLHDLARPFEERGTPLSREVVAAILQASGGLPALVTFGLEALWPLEEVTVADVTAAYSDFQTRFREFLKDYQHSFADPRLSQAPSKVLKLVLASDGTVSREQLRRACDSPGSLLHLRFDDALDLLQAAGLIRLESSIRADPVRVRPIPSILTLPTTPSKQADTRRRLVEDLQGLLTWVHTASADFFQPTAGKPLVHEVVFSSHLALGLEKLGWQVEREAQLGAGRTDLKLRAAGSGELAVIEVKIWGRRHELVQEQIESYWSVEVRAGAVVMLTDRQQGDWPTAYRAGCLSRDGLTVREGETTGVPIGARFEVSSRTSAGLQAEVDHFLLRLMRRD